MARALSTAPLTGGALQATILELIATGSSADQVLRQTCTLIEQSRPDTICCALFLDPSSGLLGDAVAPSLSHAARTALEGLPCAPDTGSCGTAAYTDTAVLVSDTRTDRRWQKDFLQSFAVRNDIRSCWSIPFRDVHGTVLGTFAISGTRPGPPDEDDLHVLRTASHLAGIAVQQTRTAAHLQEVKEAALKHGCHRDDMSHIAAAIAHDFNHLLSIIKALTRLALDELPADAPGNPDLQRVLQATDSASDLTQQLRSLAQGEALEREPIELCTVLRETTELIDRTMLENIELSVEIRVPEVWVMASRIALEQLILNLAVNAREAMPTGGHLDFLVDIDEATGTALLKISDTGTGLDADAQDHIFDPYFTTKSEGTGLGLATCTAIATRLRGTLTYDETYELGASFDVRLPTHSRPLREVGPEVPSPSTCAARVGRVLIVDDAPTLRSVASRVLRRAGHTPLEAGSAADALAILESDPGVNVMLTDLQLPARSGLALAMMARNRHPHLQVVFMSGHRHPGIGLDDGQGATTHFLAKPFSPRELIQAVSTAFKAIDEKHRATET